MASNAYGSHERAVAPRAVIRLRRCETAHSSTNPIATPHSIGFATSWTVADRDPCSGAQAIAGTSAAAATIRALGPSGQSRRAVVTIIVPSMKASSVAETESGSAATRPRNGRTKARPSTITAASASGARRYVPRSPAMGSESSLPTVPRTLPRTAPVICAPPWTTSPRAVARCARGRPVASLAISIAATVLNATMAAPMTNGTATARLSCGAPHGSSAGAARPPDRSACGTPSTTHRDAGADDERTQEGIGAQRPPSLQHDGGGERRGRRDPARRRPQRMGPARCDGALDRGRHHGDRHDEDEDHARQRGEDAQEQPVEAQEPERDHRRARDEHPAGDLREAVPAAGHHDDRGEVAGGGPLVEREPVAERHLARGSRARA